MIQEFTYYKDLKLDFYKPNKKNFQSIVYFHGGGFVEGSRKGKNFAAIATQLCEAGYGVFTVDYSLYPNAKHPQFILEAAAATKFAFDHVKELGGNGDIFLSGQSAGAYLCMQLCCNKKYLGDHGLSPLDVKAWVFEAGSPFDNWCYLKWETKIDYWTKRITDMAPIYHVQTGFKTNPIFLIVYTQDICCRQEENMLFKKLIEWHDNEAQVDYKVLEGKHAAGSSNVDPDGKYPYVKETLAYLKKFQ